MKGKKPVVASVVLIVICSVLLAVFVPLGLSGYFTPAGMEINTRQSEKEEGFNQQDFTFVPMSVSSSTKGKYATFTFLYRDKEYPIKFYLLENYAPKTVENFAHYVNRGDYTGTVLYESRVERDDGGAVEKIYLQGGMYKKTKEGLAYCEPAEYRGEIEGEFPANKWEKNTMSLTEGVLCMARKTSDYNSADTEFFFLPKGDTEKNGYYAPFGIIADKKDNETLCSFAVDMAKNPHEYPVLIKSIKITTKK